MPNIYEEIGRIIKDLRQTYLGGSLSQEQLADNIGVPPNTLSRWETGTYKPTAENLYKLSRFFKVSIAIFFPERKVDDSRIAALTSATHSLGENDFDEVVRYAEFRKARAVLSSAKKPKSKRKKT